MVLQPSLLPLLVSKTSGTSSPCTTLSIWLPSQTHQALLKEKLREATVAFEEYTKSTGQYTDWKYITYANPEQNLLVSVPSGITVTKNVAQCRSD